MSSQDDDGQQGLVLGVVFAVISLVIALVIGVGIYQARQVGDVGQGGQADQSNNEQVLAQVIAIVNAPDPESAALTMPTDMAATEQAARDAASVKVENGTVKFYFASGKAELAAGASDALADLIKGAKTGRKLVISGFHDATGDAAKNAELAKLRAMAVRDALKTAGVAEQQIELKKPEQMASSGSNADARRVEVSLQ